MDQTLLFAFSLTLLAGLATGIGSFMVLFTSKTNKTFLSFCLGFSAGVMLYVSFVEILPKSIESLRELYGNHYGLIYGVLSFFGGILLIALIDFIIPSSSNPHEAHTVEEINEDSSKNHALLRMGLFTALAISIHNFPEGLATFVSALNDPQTGIVISIAIALHNIPEGIAVAIPIYYATGSRMKAFKYSFLSGLSEAIGAILGYFLLIHFFGNDLFGFIFGSVAGIMVYISIDELLPASQAYGKHHWSMFGVISGMAIMALSLILLI